MSERVKWIQYKGKDILYNDFSNAGEDEFLKAVDESEKKILNSGKSIVLTISNITNVKMNKAMKNRTAQLTEKKIAAGIKTISSMLGITGLQRIIVNAVKKDIYFAESEEAAKEWIIKQGK